MQTRPVHVADALIVTPTLETVMSQLDPSRAITRENYDAILFDLDGVLTATAKVHATCWKQMFDGYLHEREAKYKEPFQEFDIESDYKLYVDGKPRLDGIRSFLESRGIKIPDGSDDDVASKETVVGLGNRKNAMVTEHIATKGVEIYEGSVVFTKLMHQLGIKTAIVSSSKNCQAVLKAAKLEDLFDTRVDGEVAAHLGLPGKPAPDTFLKAAERLGVEAKRAVVVEDAISGVQAGHAGDFGLVIGVAREDNHEALRENGADIVVSDLAELLP